MPSRYGYAHQQARKRALAAHHDGDTCHLCGEPMYQDQGLALDHTIDGTAYRGLTHSWCNSLDGARRGGQATYRKTHGIPAQYVPASRNW